jgi:hypothetical protein
MQADYLAEKKSKAKKVNNSLKRVKVYWNWKIVFLISFIKNAWMNLGRNSPGNCFLQSGLPATCFDVSTLKPTISGWSMVHHHCHYQTSTHKSFIRARYSFCGKMDGVISPLLLTTKNIQE